MSGLDKIYTGLSILFCVLIVVGNLIYQKFVALPFLSLHTFEVSVGAILYPLTYLITDLIVEFYDKDKARFCVQLSIFINILVVGIIGLMDLLPATSWSKVNDSMFHHVFGFYGVAFIGSIVACYVSQLVDIKIYIWIDQKTQGKYLWLRNNASTAVSLFIDTCIVIGFLSFFKILPQDRIGTLIMNSYSFKLFFSVCSTPLFYIAVKSIRKILQEK